MKVASGSNRTAGALVPIVMAALLFLFLTPTTAGAHHKDDHQRGNNHQSGDHDGDADDDPNTVQSEPTNESDGGDNAHPSGRDRSVENRTESNPNQGKAESDPDGTSNGGPDKPNGPGGDDPVDQDGNNGCGNDDDFEDDNNGNCGGLQDQVLASVMSEGFEVNVEVQAAEVEVDVAGNPEVLPALIEKPEADDQEAQVLGEVISAAEEGAPDVLAARAAAVEAGALPFTGTDRLPVAAIGLILILLGTLLLRRTKPVV